MDSDKLKGLIGYFSSKTFVNLNDKDKQLLYKTLRLPPDERLASLYLKIGFFSEIESDLYLKKANDSQIELILQNALPLDFKKIDVIVYLIVKNYPKKVKEVGNFISLLPKELKKNIVKSVLFSEKELTVLSYYLHDDVDFVISLISTQKLTRNIFKILVGSHEPDVLFYLSNYDVLIKEDLHLVNLLLKNPFTPDEAVIRLKNIKYEIEEKVKIEEEKEEEENVETKEIVELPEEYEKKVDEEVEESLYARILKMTVPQKIKLALKGNKSARSILIKDSNKQVALSVLKNPRLTENEIEMVTKNKVTPDYILREIARNSNWMKSYQIVKNLVFNPKTPADIGLQLIHRLHLKDLENLSKSRDVPTVINNQAQRLVKQKSKRR